MLNSPTTWGQHQHQQNAAAALGPASSSPYFSIALYAAGNVLAVAILILIWYSWGILAAFQEPLLWAWLCSLSLRDVKRFLVSTARSELHRSSFVVCCAKLVFLPAVVAWQVIEEVRDKLAAKYQELQLNSQHQALASDRHTAAGAAAAAAAAAEQQDTAPASSSCAAGEPCWEEGGPSGSAQPHAEHAGRRDGQQAAASSKGSKASQQVLRQRNNTASKGQQQQQQPQQQSQQQLKSQRPPLGPRPVAATVNGTATATAASAAAVAAARKHGGGSRKGAAASGGVKGSTQQLSRGQAPPPAAGRKAQAGPAAVASPFQQRVARVQDVVRQLFSGYGFIIGELLRFILGGLLPRRSSSLATAATVAEQQQRQQQQRQQTWPAVVASTNGTLTAASLPPPIGGVVSVSVGAVGVQQLHAGVVGTPHQLPQYLDLSSCSNSSSYPTTVAGSRADSFNGSSCRSECNMPWTPHPHWVALLQQQQQQQQHHQHQHQQQLMQQHQQQQQSQVMRHPRLSSSSSTPSLQAAAAASVSQHASPRGGPGTAALLAGVCETGPLGLAAAVGAHLERHMTLPADVPHGTSFAGWAGATQQQQQLMSGGADTVCGQAAVAGVLGADAAAAAEHVHGGDSTQGGSCDSTGTSTAGGQRFSRAASALSLSSLPAAAAAHAGGAASVLYGSGLPHTELSTPFLTPPVSALSGFGGADGWQQSTSWDGLLGGGGGGGGRTPPGSVTGMAGGNGGGSCSSPSAVLFKGLLRGIVLFEGYRFVRGFLTAEQSLFIPLLVLVATLAVAGGLPFLLLPSSLLNPHAATADGPADSKPGKSAATAAISSRRRMRSPFSDAAAAGTAATSTGAKGSKHAGSDAAGILPSSASSMLLRLWVCLQQSYAVVCSRAVSVCVKADTALRNACASSLLDTAVSGLIVVGLILGSVVLGAVLLVQVGDESRQAVVSVNSLVRHKSTQAGLTEGVWSLVQQYEGQLVGMTQYVLQETLPGLTLYVETRASDFLISHNLSKVLIDWELVRAALKLPADCGDEAKLRLAVQLANSSLAESQLSTEKHALQQQLDKQQQRLHMLAAQLEGLWLNGSSGGGSNGSISNSSSSTNSSALAHEVLEVQAAVESLQDKLHSAVTGHEAASEQLKLAELRMHNCQPTNTTSGAAAAAAGFAAGAAQGRGLLSSLLGGFTASKNASDAAAGGAGGLQDSSMRAGGQGMGVMANPASHVRGVLIALAKFDFATAGAEVASMLGQLMPEEEDAPQQQQPQKQVDEVVLLQQQQQQQSLRQLHADGTCGLLDQEDHESSAATDPQPQQPLGQLPLAPSGISSNPQCSSNTTCGPVPPPASTSSSSSMDAAKTPGGTAVAQQGSSVSGSTSSSTGTSLVRVARGAAYPLITMLRHLSGLVVAGMGSGAAVTLGAGLGVLRLGLGVAKFLVQLGVFASVLYTLLALDIDPVEQLVKLLPISEASQERASRAVTKALRGVFVSSLKLAAFHAGFTWLTLRAFGTHFVCTATVASAIVAVLPLVPVYLTALPGVLELVLARGAPVKGLVLLALHVGAYTFGDDLIYREIDPQLPYLVGLGVFGGMWHFANPLQGVLLGPMVLALLSVGYNLHREMY